MYSISEQQWLHWDRSLPVMDVPQNMVQDCLNATLMPCTSAGRETKTGRWMGGMWAAEGRRGSMNIHCLLTIFAPCKQLSHRWVHHADNESSMKIRLYRYRMPTTLCSSIAQPILLHMPFLWKRMWSINLACQGLMLHCFLLLLHQCSL